MESRLLRVDLTKRELKSEASHSVFEKWIEEQESTTGSCGSIFLRDINCDPRGPDNIFVLSG